MVETDYLHYDENVDHLTIYKANEKISTNMDIGLAILSFNAKKEIVGIEFMGANKNLKVPLDILRNVKGCNVEIHYNPQRKFIVVTVFLKHHGREAPIAVTSSLDLGKNAFSDVFSCSAAA